MIRFGPLPAATLLACGIFLAVVSCGGENGVGGPTHTGAATPDTFFNTDDAGVACVDSTTCLIGQACINGFCTDSSGNGGSGSGFPCLTDFECPPGEECYLDADAGTSTCQTAGTVSERPKQPCSKDIDCPVGFFCEAGFCEEGTGRVCNDQSDCPITEVCAAGKCKRGAREKCGQDAECGADMVCLADKGQCVAGLPSDGRELQVDPQYLDFGAVAFGQELRRTIRLKSIGSKDVEVMSIAFDALSSGAFILDPNPPLSSSAILAPQEEFNFDVVYRPDDAEPDVGTIEILNNTTLPKISIPIGSSYKGVPDIVLLSPQDESQIFPLGTIQSWLLNYQTIDIGDKIRTEFLIKNNGSGSAILAINSFDFVQGTGYNNDQFGIELKEYGGHDITTLPVFLNPGEQLIGVVIYQPTVKGRHSAIVEIATNDPDATGDGAEDDGSVLIELTGAAGIKPGLLRYDPPRIDFGIVEIGEESDKEFIELANVSPDTEIELDWLCLPGDVLDDAHRECGEFILDDVPDKLGPNLETNIGVKFVPLLKGNREKIVQIANNSENAPMVKITLAGVGAKPGISVLPSTQLRFPDTPYGGEATPIDVFISNTGTSDLVIYAVNPPTGDPEISFTKNPMIGGSLTVFPLKLVPNGPTLNLQVGFKPNEIKVYQASIIVAHQDIEGKTQTEITVQGGGSDCGAGYIDLNGLPDDGCEYFCQVLNPLDTPELVPPFEDSNCDGIDGDMRAAIFVTSSGNDNATGQWGEPVKTLSVAIDKARQQALTSIYVSQGDYQLPDTLNIAAGISIYGGYVANRVETACPLGWCRDATAFANLNGKKNPAVSASDVRDLTYLNFLNIEGADSNSPTGGNAVALSVFNSGQLELWSMRVKSGLPKDGAPGAPAPPTAASGGQNGQRGGSGGEDGGTFWGLGCPSGGRAGGGPGGSPVACPNGLASGYGGGGGGSGCKDDSGSGGAGGGPSGTAPGGSGGGNNGAPGNSPSQSPSPNGNPGAAGVKFGLYNNGVWTPSASTDGEAGVNGAGGGGGGGGRGASCGFGICCYDCGGGGGGGGSGGCGGLDGKGGTGGYGSFAVFLVNSQIKVKESELTTSQGGGGGDGGSGQPGGPGGDPGAGGNGNQNAGNGGLAGKGGTGGLGGAGGGGAGGPSAAVLVDPDSQLEVQNNKYNLGGGGPGGTSSQQAGPTGMNCARLTYAQDPTLDPTCSSN